VTKTKRKYLKRVPDLKTGIPWVYFRYADGTLEDLPRDETSAAFARDYDRCLAMRNVAPKVARPLPVELPGNFVKYGPGTIGRFIELYLLSDAFTKPRGQGGLAEGSKINYRKALDLTKKKLGTGLLTDVDEEAVEVFMAEVKRERNSASAADLQCSLLSNLWEFAKGYKEFQRKGKSNPTLGVKKLYSVKRKTQAWPEHVQKAFYSTARNTLVDAYMLLRFTAQRGGDGTKVRWDEQSARSETPFAGYLDEACERLMLIQKKTRTKVAHKLPDPLGKWLKQLKTERAEQGITSPFVLLNAYNRPWANATSLGNSIIRHLKTLNIPGTVDKATRLTMHGLRATAAAEIISFGGGRHGVKAVTGLKSDQLADDYAAQHDQERLNAETVAMWNAELARKDAKKWAGAAKRGRGRPKREAAATNVVKLRRVVNGK
jgi:hypothetical protein